MNAESTAPETILFVYVTVNNLDHAKRIGRELIEGRLAACINIIEGMQSIYRWQEAICEDREVVMIAKTTVSMSKRVIAAIRAIHPYDCPCIVMFPVAVGYAPFLSWIADQVQPAGSEIGSTAR